MIHQLTKNKEKTLLNKLRRPLPLSFISKYILNCNDYDAIKILQHYIELGLIEKQINNIYQTK
jgi:hypothetical protein